MRFAHVADLHIGKKLHEASLLRDQEEALSDIAEKIAGLRPDAVFLAGDIYDHPTPGADAVALLDRFLNALLFSGAEVFIIGGNHDSQERLSFARDILARQGLHIARPYAGALERHEVGGARVYLLPFVRPKEVERFFDGARFESSEDAVSAILAREEIDPARDNVLVTHLFASARGTRPETSDSEINPVGGLNEVDASLFDPFRYVALGHLHAPQRVGRAGVRYAGSPLKYSFSEWRHKKSFAAGELLKGELKVELLPVRALRGMRELKGRLSDLLSPETVAAGDPEDYLRVTLTDEVPPVSPMERLSAVYKNVLRLELAGGTREAVGAPSVADREPMELFAEFYRLMNGAEMTEEMARMACEAFDAARGGCGA